MAEQEVAKPDRESLLDVMREHPFCRGLSEAHLQTMADSAMLKEFAKDEMIFCEGDLANRFYLIREGEVALESRARGAPSRIVQYIEAGSVLGWSWLFPPYSWNFDARATKPTKAIFFYGTRLREQCEADPALGYELMKRMAEIVIERLQGTRQTFLKAFVEQARVKNNEPSSKEIS